MQFSEILVLKTSAIRASLHALADGGGRFIAHASSIANNEFGNLTARVWTSGTSANHEGNREGMMISNDVVRLPLGVCRLVAVAELVARQIIISGDLCTLQNWKGGTWKLTQMWASLGAKPVLR